MSKKNYTHNNDESCLSEIVKSLKMKIIARGDLPYVSVKKMLEIVDDLCTFSLGRFFLERKGANGFWTDYIISAPIRNSNINFDGNPLSSMEKFILNRCPLSIATQERFTIFQRVIQKHLKENITLASIPCGLMRDLLTLDYSRIKEFSIIGIDIDSESLSFAEKNAKELNLESHVTLFQEDAWSLQMINEIDLITSNGLNVYISDREQVIELYKKFHSLLKKNGILVVGVLTYPPEEKMQTEWKLDGLPEEDLLLERILYEDILQCKWRNYSTSDDIHRDFVASGFSDLQIMYDKHRIFPTVVARK